MGDQAFDSAERLGKRKALEPVEKRLDGGLPAREFEAQHRAEAGLLARGEFMAGVIGETRVVDARDRRMAV